MRARRAKDLVEQPRQRFGFVLDTEKEVLRLELQATRLHAAILEIKINPPADYFDKLESYKAGIDNSLRAIRNLSSYE
jgi:hypothetical protein